MLAIGRGTCVARAALAVLSLVTACGKATAITELVSLPATLADSVATAYHEDAVRLVARADGPAGPVRPSPAAVAVLENALLRVYAATLPAADSVTRRHPIHTFPDPPTRELIVSIAQGNRWADAWRAGRALTGEPAVDSVVQAYGLSVAKYYAWSSGDAALLRSGEPLNAPALARLLQGAPGVRDAQPNRAIGGGDDIRARLEAGAVVLDYSVAWGDCPAGCINAHVWHFRVSDAGAVTFLGSAGPQPPAP